MIIKIKSNKKPTFKSLLKYMFNNKDRLKDISNKSFTLIHNLKGTEIEHWHTQLLENEKFRKVKRSNSVYFTHEILSWHIDDSEHLTLDKMEAMTKEYISMRNPRGMYVATPHFDKGHFHVHILASGIENKTGRALRLSRAELTYLKKGMQEHQIVKFPELKKSIVGIGKKLKNRVKDKEYQLKIRSDRATDKDQLQEIIKVCYKKASSLESFYKLLEEKKVTTYERAGKLIGVVYNKTKFRFSRLEIPEAQMNYLERKVYRTIDHKKEKQFEISKFEI